MTGSELLKIRKEHKWSIKWLSYQLDCSRQTIHNYEKRGEGEIPRDTALAIKALLSKL